MSGRPPVPTVTPMTNDTTTQDGRTALGQEAADRLSAEFHRCFSELEARADLFAPDTLFDFLPPFWRFQMRGPGEVFTGQLRSIATGPAEVEIIRTIPTATGFVTEHVETQHTPTGVLTARRMHLCEVRDDRITRGHHLLQRALGRRAAPPARGRGPDGGRT